jgi:hypothetical protein
LALNPALKLQAAGGHPQPRFCAAHSFNMMRKQAHSFFLRQSEVEFLPKSLKMIRKSLQ